MNRLHLIQVIIGVLFLCGSVAWAQTDAVRDQQKSGTNAIVSEQVATDVAELESVPANSSGISSYGSGGGMGGGWMRGMGGGMGGLYGGRSGGTRIDVTVPSLNAVSYKNRLGSRVDSVLVVPTRDISVETMKIIQEDMTIMGRILYKRIRPEGGYDYVYGFASDYYSTLDTLRLPWSGGSTVDGMYLQDYGVIYFLRVKMSLLPPIQTEEKKAEEPVTDPLWAATKQELQTKQNTGYNTWQANTVRRRQSQSAPYDAEKVAGLKQSLHKALRHASNIRTLKAEEWITVVVIGEAAYNVTEKIIVNKPDEYGESMVMVMDPFTGQKAASGQTVLTMRVKKADVDAVAKKDINQEEFEKRVQMFTYAAAGISRPQATSVSPPTTVPPQPTVPDTKR